VERRDLFATKPMARLFEECGANPLHPTLGAASLTALGVGGIIGTGIFVLLGVTAAQNAGPAVIVSLVIAAIGCAFAALCYAEFAAMVPVSGSAYAYTYATLGEFVAWFVGWNLVLEYMFAVATVSVGWSRYFVKLLESLGLGALPASLTSAPFDLGPDGVSLRATGAVLNLPAVAIVALVTAVCYVGIRQSSLVNGVVVAAKIVVILLVIAFGASYVDTVHWTPFVPANTGVRGEYGVSGVLLASGIIFFAFIGFDAVSTAAQEAKRPARDMPVAIIASLLICTVLYVLMSAVLTGLVPYPNLNDAAPVAVALMAHPGLRWLVPWAIVGAIAGMTSVMLVMTLAQARIFLAMSRDGLLPPALGRVHPRFRTPHVATLVTGLCAAAIGGLFPIVVLGAMVSIGTLVAFIIVCAGVMILRRTRPDVPRPFRVPAVNLTATLGILFCSLMAASLPAGTWWRLVIWTAIGVAVYFGYGYRSSWLRRPAPESSAP
jgi:APA family basic amino acid/polyamine antiporter